MILIGCGGDGDLGNADFRFRDVGQAAVLSPAGEVGTIRFLSFVTDADGDNATERITAVGATDEDGVIAVADLASCDVALIDVRSAQRIKTVGRCGEGPAEFSFISGLELRNDSLYVFDANRQLLQVIDAAGEEVVRQRFSDWWPGEPGRLVWGGVFRPGELLLVRSHNGREAPGDTTWPDWRTPVFTVALASGKREWSALRIPQAAEVVAQRAGMFHPMRACVRPDRAQLGREVVITHRLAMESVVLKSLRPTVRSVTREEWMTPVPDTTVPGGMAWGIDRAEVACGTDMYALGVRSFEGSDERERDTAGRLEVRTYDGKVITAHSWQSGEGGPTPGSPKVILGDTLVTLAIDNEGWQRVALWKVSP
jgi:hypothetical protein